MFKLLICAICALFLAQCTKISVEHPFKGQQPLASPYTMTSAAYLAMADNQLGHEKQALMVMAAGRLIYDGQWRQGAAILSQLGPLTDDLADQKSLLLAKVALIREQPNAAIGVLSNVHDVNRLPIYFQVQYHEMLASAYQATGHPVEAAEERIKLDGLLPDESSRSNNRRVLWLSLTTLSKPELDTLAAELSSDDALNGWVQLAAVARKQYVNSQDILQNIEHWRLQFPHHPANYLLPSSLDSISQRLFASPKQIALLLPTTGSLAGPGQAIKDGFIAAYEASDRRQDVQVRLYNANTNRIDLLYQQAVADGADYVVGPLSKPQVTEIAKLAHPIPTLLLNEVDIKPSAGAYQFGLSPTNEARQVAVKASKNGYSHALIIVPAGVWGDEILSAFTAQWHAGGGQIVETLHYSPQDDLTTSIQYLLRASASDDRKKRVKQPGNVEVKPMRRQDFDVIFLVAYPTKARQIMPLLRYYYAGNVPVYATSSVYSGTINTQKDRDLNNIIFCDMPWVFSHQMGNHHWPEQFNSYNRLYALGMDSYALSTQLNQLLLFPALGVNDKSGVLYLNQNQQISRILVFGQFRLGVAQLLNRSSP